MLHRIFPGLTPNIREHGPGATLDGPGSDTKEAKPVCFSAS